MTKWSSTNVESNVIYETAEKERNKDKYQVESTQITLKKSASKQIKSSNLQLSVVIPVYNEEKSIKNILNKILNDEEIEIIVVDDGSTDKSYLEAINSNKSIKLIRHKENQGYGNALLTGINNASGDIIITMDSDGQHNPNEIYRLIEPILNDKADICIGSRYLGRCNYNIPFLTRVGECIIEKTLRLFFRQKVCNNQSGYRALKREAVSIFDDIKFNGFTSATEVLIKSKLKGYRVKEVPIVLEPRKYGMSKIKLVKLVITLISCFAYYFLIKLRKK